ncbi:unnamed protein product, partial [marine sediment metagenome]
NASVIAERFGITLEELAAVNGVTTDELRALEVGQVLIISADAGAPLPAPEETPVPAPTEVPVPEPTEMPSPPPVETPVPAPTEEPVAEPTEEPPPP